MRILEKYEVLEELGKGGSGVVYRAVDPALGREVAIKTQKVDLARDEETVLRFLREARLIASLEHPNIVSVFEMAQDGSQVYIVMELLRGEDLCARLRSRRHLPLEQKLHVVREVARGLAHAHERGIIHRDVKPRNVFLTESGEIKLLDFGLAHISHSTLTRTGQIIGTPHYMSPEQILGARPDRRSDIFSLGALFYELLTGEKPFVASTLPRLFKRILEAEPEPIRDLAPEVSEGLSRIVSRMMRKRVEERYPAVKDLLADLAAFERHLEEKKSELRSEVESKARALKNLIARRPSASRGGELLAAVEREKLSFMALVGLRDGIDLELWRIDRNAGGPPPVSSRSDSETAEFAYQNARSRFAAGDLAGCLARVSEALRLSPRHPGASELSEELRRSVVDRAACLEKESDLDVLVAAFLAFEAGGTATVSRGESPCRDPDAIAGLSELLLAELPVEPKPRRSPA